MNDMTTTRPATGGKSGDGTFEALAGRLSGRVISPAGADYDEARLVWNGMIDRRPAAIVRCTTADDVAAALGFACERGLPISVRGGGHNVAGNAVLDDALVIDLTDMNEVRVDAERRTAAVAGGATLGDLDKATAPHGLAAPVGVVSATGVAGLTLHGGLGWLSRKYGAALDNIVSVEIVTADGQIRRASASENPDLFWAVRGGGGNFGVVTSFEFKLYPVGPEVWFAAVFYPLEQAEAALRWYREYMPTACEELGTLAVLWTAPEEEFIPVEAQGKPAIVFLACYSGPFEKGEAAIRPFRELGRPLADLSGTMPFQEVQQFLDADYPDGRNYYWKSSYVEELSDATIARLIEHTKTRPSPLTSIDVWFLGGALQRVPAGATAFGQRQAPFLIGVESNWDEAGRADENIGWAREVIDDMQRVSDAAAYLNFPGFSEEGEAQLVKAYGDNFSRLREVKAKYDPENLFRANLNIRPAAA
jgi:FAD/FMN-containing dehydrogenase